MSRHSHPFGGSRRMRREHLLALVREYRPVVREHVPAISRLAQLAEERRAEGVEVTVYRVQRGER